VSGCERANLRRDVERKVSDNSSLVTITLALYWDLESPVVGSRDCATATSQTFCAPQDLPLINKSHVLIE
jgi:hypothetical protein